jgi:hypothetical protein
MAKKRQSQKVYGSITHYWTEEINKKDAYTYLALQVKATLEAIDIKGYIQSNVRTAAQSSGCLPFHAYVGRRI